MFNLGQIRKNRNDVYMVDLEYTLNDFNTEGAYSSAIVFKDKVIDTVEALTKDTNYYLKFSVYCQPDVEQKIKIYLQNIDSEIIERYELETYTVGKGPTTEKVSFEQIIMPDDSYSQVVFELQRTGNDYMTINEDESHGRKLNMEVNTFSTLVNIIPLTGAQSLYKVGIQGQPGLLMCINGEAIRIGRTGIYEILNNSVKVTSICFVVSSNDADDYFVMDYQY